jgi:beta-barrel assembly-enhancing protease
MKSARWTAVLLIAAFLSFALPGLAGEDKKKDPNAIGDRNVAHKSLTSVEKEIAIGKQYANEIDQQARQVKDPMVTEYVNRLAQNLGRNSDLTIPLTVKVLDDPSINAFALPGGFLYVNSGLVLAADEESQVAGVISHEIAHVAARHWASQQMKSTLAQLAMIPLIFIPMSYPVYIGAMQGLQLGIPMAFLKFSRSAEAEADLLGLQYMYHAGYDPTAYVTFFSKIIEKERASPGSMSALFSDHPPTPERILSAEENIKTILPQRDQYLVSTSEFEDVKARLQTIMTTRKKDDKKDGPTLRKRDAADQTAGQAPEEPKDNKEDEKPPVLKRRD